MVKGNGKIFPILDTECCAQSLLQCTSSQPTGNFNPSTRW